MNPLKPIVVFLTLFIGLSAAANDICKANFKHEELSLRMEGDRIQSITRLLRAFRRISGPRGGNVVLNSAPQTFVGSAVGERDVYNPTKPFQFGGRTVIAARVESRNSETDTQVVFFAQNGNVWSQIEGAPIFNMQDPFYSFINAQLVLGGVQTYHRDNGTLGYRTVFYSGATTNLNHLTQVAVGPAGMKDIRLQQMEDGRILVMTRPQGRIPGTLIDAGRGKVGYTVINNLSELTPEKILSAELLPLFQSEEWGGVNEMKMLSDGRILVLGHIARFTGPNRDYYPILFTVDPSTGLVTRPQIVLERSMIEGGLDGGAKRPDLRNVLFSGGIDLTDDTAVLWVGAGDARVYRVELRRDALGI